MTTLTITAKGQITLKKELLQHLALSPGDKVEVTPSPGGRLTLAPQRVARTGRIEDAIGLLHRPGQKPLSIEEMNEVIAQGWAGELDL
ncbi:AbrB/MazE/SpoVT family DNA-binding domain-containing protein [Sphingomonas sp.]|uniref:AbrB/MazE/SpoVT family DNA-binding domain-containing protein n=1 Tax=Sphingomonas sp. TaxID=28214 RepID=UPI0035C7F5A8